MTTKEKIINRLNKGFGFNIPKDAKWLTHQRAYRECGGLSWYFSDVRLNGWENCGASESATECLSWERWCINKYAEIYPFTEDMRDSVKDGRYLIEGENQE